MTMTSSASTQAKASSFLLVPEELRARSQWVAWKYVPDPDGPKPKKVPVCPQSGASAKATDSATWGTYTQALDR
jgi:primase-polymerase (primpol)-like protein